MDHISTMDEFLEQHETRLEASYTSLVHDVRERAIKMGIHAIGSGMAVSNTGTLSEYVPRILLRRSKHTNDGLYHYELYYFVQDVRFVIPFTVMFKKEAKPIVEQLKKLCGMVYYDHYGTFYGNESDEQLFQRT